MPGRDAKSCNQRTKQMQKWKYKKHRNPFVFTAFHGETNELQKFHFLYLTPEKHFFGF